MAASRYPTAGGQTVTWTAQPGELDVEWAPPLDVGTWKCSGCHRTGLGGQGEAEGHAAKCRERQESAWTMLAERRGR
jgi:hypothetical protein